MHKDDQMTPNERLAAFMTGKPMDRILAMPVVCSMSGLALGMTHKEKRSSALNEAKAQIACYERFGNDLTVIEYGLHGVGMALGTQMSDPEDSVPAIMKYTLDDLNNVHELDMSKLELKKDKAFQLHIEACDVLIDKVGKEVPTGVLISGPFTAAASIYKTEDLLRATRKNPEKLHQLVKFCTEGLKMICREFIKTGSLILLCDPIASGTILNPKKYLEFVLPYTIDLMKDIHDAKGTVCYHICGDTTAIVGDMVKSGCDMISVDNRVDLEYTKQVVGDKVPILGNVDPVGTLILGSTNDVDLAVKTCIQKTYDSPCGYILASGCDLSGGVPLENIDQFMASARKYGKWPLNPNNFL
ncbi:uroporphyrinogen decarboxylase family protein [Clostridium botulinum]|uniref:Uroporphyrinogen decarboxylase n=2 Tax=Clostridium botulinum TaxID=1491 RepID=A5I412_CLOBH|nr:uroporphyrinogen decarboxylase family protein [Clostridium botulinum]EKX79883.1 uroporphyrinogen decarboxylase [Clostridium botulinum CFSAN001628]EPS47608.1 uroporphyrinogen decarboxylase [Clostridium botulinum CFSAN002369]ABS32949.1 uroporphyrinogen decarboxylase family protein [Clostridium botulinum A str. ATCC 19397]ABS36105.1 uroporphyrinogen decarboxylase family protein [Clostridium botulinum A str. Hall]ACA45069.1 uroporphyrinogen decarboxylase family protein [Clostridium botulinum B1